MKRHDDSLREETYDKGKRYKKGCQKEASQINQREEEREARKEERKAGLKTHPSWTSGLLLTVFALRVQTTTAALTTTTPLVALGDLRKTRRFP